MTASNTITHIFGATSSNTGLRDRDDRRSSVVMLVLFSFVNVYNLFELFVICSCSMNDPVVLCCGLRTKSLWIVAVLLRSA